MMTLFVCALLSAAPGDEGMPAVTRVELKNGMRWLLFSRKQSTVRLSGAVVVRAGSVDERPDATGVAHLLEHLAFSGTPFIGSTRGWRVEQPFHDEALAAVDSLAKLEKDGRGTSPEALRLLTALPRLEEDWRQRGNSEAWRDEMSRRLAWCNAATGKHTTTYGCNLPREHLQFWLTSEAQRFAAPVFREFRRERSVVIQELRDRSTPSSPGLAELLRLAFGDSGYGWSVNGREEHLRTLAPVDLDAFYARLYAPANAVGALVGDFDVDEAKALIEQTFGALPSRPTDPTSTPTMNAPARKRLEAHTDALLVGFPMPARRTVDWERMMIAASMLLSARASGIIASLTGPDGVAAAIQVGEQPGSWDPHLLVVTLTPAAGRTLAELEAAWWSAVERFVPAPDDEELARSTLALKGARSMSTSDRLADTLATSELMWGDWQAVWTRKNPEPSREEVLEALGQRFRRDGAFVVEQVRAR